MSELSQQHSRVQQLERLVEINHSLASTFDLDKLLQVIVNVACELTTSEACSILLFDPTTGELRFETVPGFQRMNIEELSVPLENSVAGYIFTSGLPMVIQDAKSDPRVYREIDRTLEFETRSLLGVPLLIKEKPIGVLEAVNKLDQSHYTEDDLAVLETLASQAAIAIENARLMQRLHEANKELLHLDRMKSEFIAIASHELRTPLGLILGHASFLKETATEEQDEQIDIVMRSAMRLKEIVEDMATITHKEKGQSLVRRESFSMAELITESVRSYDQLAKSKQIKLGLDLPSAQTMNVQGDREKLRVVLNNLIENAIIYTDDGGHVGVKAEEDGGYIKTFVIDTGIGIPPSSQARVFERFYQVESHLTRKHGGMGLGLSIAKAMVDIHNGQIWCESKPGMGSLFCFMIPVDEARAASAARVFHNDE
jgi:signal transduction histidine kinase